MVGTSNRFLWIGGVGSDPPPAEGAVMGGGANPGSLPDFSGYVWSICTEQLSSASDR